MLINGKTGVGINFFSGNISVRKKTTPEGISMLVDCEVHDRYSVTDGEPLDFLILELSAVLECLRQFKERCVDEPEDSEEGEEHGS